MNNEAKVELVHKYHALCSVNGIKEFEKEAIKESYGVSSISDLSINQLVELIGKLDSKANMWRRRVMAAVGAYLRRLNYTENLQTIKAVACRAAGYENFNSIPVSRLREVYYEFLRRNKTAEGTAVEISRLEHELSNLN